MQDKTVVNTPNLVYPTRDAAVHFVVADGENKHLSHSVFRKTVFFLSNLTVALLVPRAFNAGRKFGTDSSSASMTYVQCKMADSERCYGGETVSE